MRKISLIFAITLLVSSSLLFAISDRAIKKMKSESRVALIVENNNYFKSNFF